MEEAKLFCINASISEIKGCEDLVVLKRWATIVQAQIVEIKTSMTSAWTKAEENNDEPDPQWQLKVRKAKSLHAYYLSNIQRQIGELKFFKLATLILEDNTATTTKDKNLKKKHLNQATVTNILFYSNLTQKKVEFFNSLLQQLEIAIKSDDEIIIFSEPTQDLLIDLFRTASPLDFNFKEVFLDCFDFNFIVHRRHQNFQRNDLFSPGCFDAKNDLGFALVQFMEFKQYSFVLKRVIWKTPNQVELEIYSEFC